MHREPDRSTRPLIIGGMHRSGTSFTASLFADAGIDIGPELLGANPSNPRGHFEDLGFFNFHRRALVAQGLDSKGYTASARGVVYAALEHEARDLLAARMRPGVAWGWKEPRTTLFLDFWQERLPDAGHVFVFRRPWEVADSLFRRGDDTFSLNPAFALDVWTHYNRLIIDFFKRHSTRCLVFEISQVIADPHAVIDAVRSRLHVPLATPSDHYCGTLFHRDDAPTRATLVRALAPEAWRTYLELRELAGSSADPAPRERPLGECIALEWARASRAATLAREAEELAHAEFKARVEAEERIHAAEVEARTRTEAEERIRAEVDERLRAAAAERRRRRSPVVAVRRATGKLLDGIAAAARRLARPERPAPAEAPALLPFPQARGHEAQRAA